MINFHYVKVCFPVVGIIISLSTCSEASGHTEWSYTVDTSGPSRWGTLYPTCAGTEQSPINLGIGQSIYDPRMKPVNLFLKAGADLSSQSYTISNNGHTVTVTFPSSLWFVSLTNDMSEQYEVAQMHFHWGAASSRGSEHTVENRVYALETHVVCFNKMLYANGTTALGAPHGLAVLGFLSQVVDNVPEANTFLAVLGNAWNQIQSVRQHETSVTIPAFDLRAILRQVNPASYFRYRGSLTTPPCTQNVLWTVFNANPIVTENQLTELRKLQFGTSDNANQMMDNYRPPQTLNPDGTPLFREIYRSWNASVSLAPGLIPIAIVLLMELLKS